MHQVQAVTQEHPQHTAYWQEAQHELTGLPNNQGINIAFEAVDRHARTPKYAAKIALRWYRRDRSSIDMSYGELSQQSNRFANLLRHYGIKPGDSVFSFLGRTPALYIACFGSLKAQAVFSPLFSVFGPEPARMRLALGHAKLLITTTKLYRKKIAPIRQQLPELKFVVTIADSPADANADLVDTIDFDSALAGMSSTFTIPPTPPETPALLHFTSGTTGMPKAALHVHAAVIAHHMTGQSVLDLHSQDTFWCTADPGWVTGISYGMIAPLSNGVTMIVDEGEFDPERWYELLQTERVNIWYTAPTAIRMLMQAGDELARHYDLSHLRLIASVGEPLNAEAVIWGERVLGIPIRDNWWQTETGGIMIANLPGAKIKPGSMGKAIPGITASVVQRLEPTVASGVMPTISQHLQHIHSPNCVGELAIQVGWPSMFRAYLGQDERYRSCFADGWYLTGDLVKQDEDGYFWFVGRSDDVIKSAGHLIGPFEVESSLMEHPAVAEAAVIGKPDAILGESVKAFVALKFGYKPDAALRRDIIALARQRLGPAVAPREITFLPSLPKTRSGKIMRRLLKSRELGLPEGDTSTLETYVPARREHSNESSIHS